MFSCCLSFHLYTAVAVATAYHVIPITVTAESSLAALENDILVEKVNSLHVSSTDNNGNIKEFNLSKDEIVNEQASEIEEDVVSLPVNKIEASDGQQSRLDHVNEKPLLYMSNILPYEDTMDSLNTDSDYFYPSLLNDKHDSGSNIEPNQGIDDSFYIKPVSSFDSNVEAVIFSNVQKLSAEDKVYFDVIPSDSFLNDKNIHETKDVANIQIITFFEEVPVENLPKQTPNLDYYIGGSPVDETKTDITVTKSRVSLFLVGWLFMVTGVALSCFIAIAGQKAANKKTSQAKKKFCALGEHPYQALGSEV